MKIDLDRIQKIYGESVIYNIKENLENVIGNMNYLITKGFNNVNEIIEQNPFLFIKSCEIFQEKIDSLIKNLGVEYIEKLEDNTFLWGEIDD